MIFKVEVLRAWDSGWDTAWIEIDTGQPSEEYQYLHWKKPDSELAHEITQIWVETVAPVGLKHAAPVYWEEIDDEYYCPECGDAWFVHDDDGSCVKVKSDLGDYIHAGGNLTQSDLNTLKLMGRGRISEAKSDLDKTQTRWAVTFWPQRNGSLSLAISIAQDRDYEDYLSEFETSYPTSLDNEARVQIGKDIIRILDSYTSKPEQSKHIRAYISDDGIPSGWDIPMGLDKGT